MTSSAPTEVIGLRKMGLGDNVNTWGDPNLNINFDTVSRLAKGWQTVTITGDTTVSESNYSSSNQTAVPFIRLTGIPSAAFNYVLPARPNYFILKNETSYACTPKLSASSGFSLPAGRTALVATDGATDVYNISPNVIAPITETNNRDLVDLEALNAAIANSASTVTAPGTVRITALDTTSKFLSTAITSQVGTVASVQVSTVNPGANEQLGLSVTVRGLALASGSTISTTGQTVAVGTLWPVDCNTTTAITTIGPAAPAVGDLLGFYKYGTGTHTFNLNSLKYRGSTSNPVSSDEGAAIFFYSGTARGWVDL